MIPCPRCQEPKPEADLYCHDCEVGLAFGT